MRITKKIILIITALLPIIAILAFIISNIGSDTSIDYIPLGTINIIDNNGIFISTEDNTWAHYFLNPIFGSDPLTGIFETFAKLLLFLESNIGLPICFPIIGSIVLLLYIAWIELISALIDLITFIPRKCSELFK